MPTRAGKEYLLHSGRLDHNLPMNADSSITLGDEDVEQIPESAESEIDSDEHASLASIHDGTTPVIEDTPASRRSSPRPTPCPGGRSFRHVHTRGLQDIHNYSPSDIDMPDAPTMTPLETINQYENDRAFSRAIHSARAREQERVPGTTAGLIQRHAIHNAIIKNHAARFRARQVENSVNGFELTEVGSGRKTGDSSIAERRSKGRSGRETLAVLGALMVLLLLLYLVFCWLNWPEISYVRRRRRQVLGI